MQINCLEFVEQKKAALKLEIEQIAEQLTLVVINVGDNLASKSYIKNKVKIGTELGIQVRVLEFANQTEAGLIQLIQQLNVDPTVHGIILQLPLPKHLDAVKIMNEINPEKDVDCLTKANYAKFLLNRSAVPGLTPCTALGIYELLKWKKMELRGANAVIINRSEIVGRPLFNLLVNADATVTLCHSKTRDWRLYTKTADLVVLGVGQANFLQKTDLKPGAWVIDVSINRNAEGKLCGDANYLDIVSDWEITPVPKGIGPITVVMIFHNLIYLFQNRHLTKK